MDQIWQLSTYILEDKIISFDYLKEDERVEAKNVKPISIISSEDYFYLTVIQSNSEKYSTKNFQLDKINGIKADTANSF
jgi:predicted DNA-binding transcriptional regulator YafY